MVHWNEPYISTPSRIVKTRYCKKKMVRVTNILRTKRKGKAHNVSGQTKMEEINLQIPTRSKKRK